MSAAMQTTFFLVSRRLLTHNVNSLHKFVSKPTVHLCLRQFPFQINGFTRKFSMGMGKSRLSHFDKVKRWTSVTVLTTGLSLYIYSLWSRLSPTVAADGSPASKFHPIRQVRNETDSTGLVLTLFQYQTCPFCCKLRAYLDFTGISYDVVEVNSVWRTQIKWSKYRKVPILVCDKQGPEGYLSLQDSSVIISMIESFLTDPSMSLEKLQEFYPSIEAKNARGKTIREWPNKYFIMYGEKEVKGSTPKQRLEERQWRKWTDDVLVHALSPNVYRSMSEAVQAFHYFDEVGEWHKVFSTPERHVVVYVGAVAMYFLGKMLKKRYNLKTDVRESLYDMCQEWMSAVGPSRAFMGGDKPNLADLSVFGVMSSIQGCETFQDVRRNTNIGQWFDATKQAVKENVGSQAKHPSPSQQ